MLTRSSEKNLFASFFTGGFVCSTHCQRDGRREDVLASTRHDELARADYLRLHSAGMKTARDGIRWHLIEATPGRYDFSSVLPMLRAARETGTQVIWDLLHFGWPDGMDVLAPYFVERFAAFVAAFARVLRDEGDAVPFVCPVNEISFLSFAGGQAGFFNPFLHGCGDPLKTQFARAAIAACDAIWSEIPQARIIHTDPAINIAAKPTRPQDRLDAEGHRQAQFAAWDMIGGRLRPELGGAKKYLDILGVNYYINNQWIHGGEVLTPSRPQHLPLRYMLREISERYGRPLFIAETGIEDEARPLWLRYIGQEARAALDLGVDLHSICLYPIVNHPGWDDERHCHNGLWDYPNANGERAIYQPLARELQRQQELCEEHRAAPSGGVSDAVESGFDHTAWRELDWFTRLTDERTQRSREAA